MLICSEDDDISTHTLTNEALNVSQNTSESKDYKTASSNDVLSESSPISSAYSPPRTNSISLPHTPDLSRICSWNKEGLDTKSVNGKTRYMVKMNESTTVCEDGISDCEDDFPAKRIKRMKKLKVSSKLLNLKYYICQISYFTLRFFFIFFYGALPISFISDQIR